MDGEKALSVFLGIFAIQSATTARPLALREGYWHWLPVGWTGATVVD